MSVDGDRLLEQLEAALRGASIINDAPVELSAQASRLGTTRFAGSRVTQTGDVADVIVQARVEIAGAVGAARVNTLEREAIARAVAQARAIAEAQARGAAATVQAGFDDGARATAEVAPSWDEATAAANAGVRAALVAPAFATTKRDGFTAAGLMATSEVALAVATSAGARRATRFTSARLDVIASDGPVASRASRFSTTIGGIDAPAIADDACDGARRARDPIELEPGAYDVILEPPAVAELLEWLALTSFGARSVEDGSSCLAGRAGERITGPVTLYDDARSGEAGCRTLPFDAEGTPTGRVVLVDGGVARTPVHDRASAARAGVSSTGHAPPVGDELFEGGPTPMHLHMAAGSDDVAQLLQRVERGLWVRRFHYVNGLLDTRRALMTGMTRDGLYLIEHGKLGRAVRNLRWTEAILDALARLDGITRARQVVAAGLSDALFVCPTLLVRGWKFGA